MKITEEKNYEDYLRVIHQYELEDLIQFSKTVKVLYVDNDIDSREDSYGIFKIFFHDIDIAGNGREGFEKFKNKKYDLIITRLDMPELNGVDMISQIRQISRHITILVLSSEQKYFIDLIRLGIDGYILKPVEVDQFVQIIKKVIEKLQNKQGLYEYRLHLEKIVEEKTKELKKINEKLQVKVNEEIEKNEKKENYIYEQAKLVSMGEMIDNIAHQWRQPLSAITTIATGLNLKLELNIFEKEDMKNDLNSLNEIAQYLSETINIFRNFIKKEKEPKNVVLQDVIEETLNIVSVLLKSKHIELINEIDYKNPVSFNMMAGEFSHVVLNIINNAKDALLDKEIENPWIKIDLQKNAQNVLFTIEDNAGGIPEEILSNVFDPYFTTKQKSNGTGLGLYMSKKIVTESLHGNLDVNNTQNGAKFTVTIPLK